MDSRALDTCMAPSMKSAVSTHSRKTSVTMMRRAMFGLLSHVAQCLWCLHGMIFHLAGPKSIMGTWWLNTTTTRSSGTTFVLTKMQSMSPVVKLVRIAHYCTWWREFVALFRVFHMWTEVSWPVLFVPSDDTEGLSKGPKEKIVQNRDLIDWLLDHVDSRDLKWRKPKRNCRHFRRVNVIHIAKLKTWM